MEVIKMWRLLNISGQLVMKMLRQNRVHDESGPFAELTCITSADLLFAVSEQLFSSLSSTSF